jgi:hypothetical protein
VDPGNRSDSEKPPTSSASSRKRQGLFRFPGTGHVQDLDIPRRYAIFLVPGEAVEGFENCGFALDEKSRSSFSGNEVRRLLNAMTVCVLEGFWLPLTVEIAGLTEAEGRAARNRLIDASLLRMLDRDRQRFRLHAFSSSQITFA